MWEKEYESLHDVRPPKWQSAREAARDEATKQQLFGKPVLTTPQRSAIRIAVLTKPKPTNACCGDPRAGTAPTAAGISRESQSKQ